MPSDLTGDLSSLDFSEDGLVVVQSADHRDQNLVLTLDVWTDAVGIPRQTWQVRCAGAVGFHLTSEVAPRVEMADADDPRLWPYAQRPAALYCVDGRPQDADALTGVLYRAHVKATAAAHTGYLFGDGLNVEHALAAGAGLVASGPIPLMQAYAAALETQGVGTSIVPGRGPVRWDGHAYVPYPTGLRLLLIGDSYVVAATFEATRVT